MALITLKDVTIAFEGVAAIEHVNLSIERGDYLVIVGEKEEAEGKVSIRVQGEGDKGQMTLEEYKDYMVGLVKAEMEANKIEK